MISSIKLYYEHYLCEAHAAWLCCIIFVCHCSAFHKPPPRDIEFYIETNRCWICALHMLPHKDKMWKSLSFDFAQIPTVFVSNYTISNFSSHSVIQLMLDACNWFIPDSLKYIISYIVLNVNCNMNCKPHFL